MADETEVSQSPALNASGHGVRLAVRVNDACTALGISRSSLYELFASGKVKSAVIAGRRVVPVSELDRLLRESMDEAG